MNIWGTMNEVDRETFMRDAIHLEQCCEELVIENDGYGTYRDPEGNPWVNNEDGTWSQSLFS